jgi:hypothetical protein
MLEKVKWYGNGDGVNCMEELNASIINGFVLLD